MKNEPDAGASAADQAKVDALLDDRLFKAFWDGVAHYGTKDLVLAFDESEEYDPVTIYKRERLLADPNIPASLKNKLSKPAKDASFAMGASDTVFWLVPMFEDGGTACVAVKAKILAPGGSA